ncbi:MAG: hypothetical protein ISS48_04530 [Candidatus Aenigmarchaeota archaeon]|nr:hypothetical protein [Candidatus Aenigmarchaeota archaeon]
MVLLKLVGWGLVFFGGVVVLFGPFNPKSQPVAVESAVIIFGIILIGIGIFLIKI